MRTTNLKNELVKERSQTVRLEEEVLLNEVCRLLYEDYCSEQRILSNVKGVSRKQEDFSWAALNPENIFTIDEIKTVCVNYRLRFLDSAKFKGEIPHEALTKVKHLENELGAEVKRFKIMAPDARFKLEDCDQDPLLFVELSDRYFYLVHQWGGDLAWYRKFLAWPLRSFATLTTTIATLALVFAMLVPTQLIMGESAANSGFARLALFFWFLVSISSILTYVGFAFFLNVSNKQWNSPFFKQEF